MLEIERLALKRQTMVRHWQKPHVNKVIHEKGSPESVSMLVTIAEYFFLACEIVEYLE